MILFLYGVTYAQADFKVVLLKGNVQIKKNQSAQWDVLNASILLEKGDQLRTTGNSEVEMAWAQYASVKLYENSIFTLQKNDRAELAALVDIGKLSVEYVGTKGTSVSISTPSAQLWAKQKSQFDITVLEDFSTEAQVNAGVVIAKAQDVITQTLVKEQYTIKMQKGYLGTPQPLKGIAAAGKGQAPEEPKDEFAILSVEVPLEGEVFAAPTVEVTGQYKQQGAVTINGQEVTLEKGGAFSTILEFPEGKNIITVTATNPSGEKVEVKRTVLVNTIAPEVQLFLPNNGAYSNQTLFKARGVTHDDTPNDTVRVLINNQPVRLNANGFSGYVSLREGKNAVAIEAHDRADNITLLDTSIFLDTQAPAVVVYAPRGAIADFLKPPLPPYRAVKVEERRWTYSVEGRVIDPEPSSGIAKLTINGIDIQLEEDGSFATEIIIDEGTNRLTIVCRDMAGNEIRDDTRIIDFK